jgi:hypothetical protein
VVAEAFCDGWYLVANGLETLQRTIDRHDRKPEQTATLTADELFKQARQPLPEGADALLFARTEPLTKRILDLLSASGQKVDPAQIEQLRRTQAVAAAT